MGRSIQPPVAAVRATWDNHVQLASYLQRKGLTADKTVAFLKGKDYTLNNLKYEATRVSAVIAGIELSTPVDKVEALVASVDLVNSGLASGSLKYTKAKGIQVMPMAKPIEPPINEVAY